MLQSCTCSSLQLIKSDCHHHPAGRNHVGQLGVGGTADVHEPSTLQVSTACGTCVHQMQFSWDTAAFALDRHTACNHTAYI